MSRLAAIDFGTARIGVAMTDPLRIITSVLSPLPGSKNLHQVAERIYAELIVPYQIEMLIIGLPIHMNGKESPLSLLVRQLSELLKSKGVSVVLWDERLTSAQSERHFKEMGLSRKKRAKVVDSHSAALMLESYLAAHS